MEAACPICAGVRGKYISMTTTTRRSLMREHQGLLFGFGIGINVRNISSPITYIDTQIGN